MLENYPDILTPEEVMEILGISRNLLYKMMRSGELPAFKVGGKLWRVRKRDLITLN